MDPQGGEPIARNKQVAATAAEHGVELQLELTSCQVETATEVMDTSSALRSELIRLRRVATEAAAANGTQLLAAGLPPTVPHTFPVTPTARYRRIAERFGMIAHEQGICGCHVHVAVPGRRHAIYVSNWLRPWLPTFLALTANSAIYRNADSGHASFRSVLWSRWPSAGPPPHFDSAAHYDAIVAMMERSGAAMDDGMIYWDVRPSANFPTVEVRVSDVPATVAETVLLATLIRAGVMTAVRAHDEGEVPARVGDYEIRAAQWKAAHDGLDGEGLYLLGEPSVLPIRDLLGRYVETVRPALETLGDYDMVTGELDRIVTEGNGAMRQRRAWRRRGEIDDVMSELASATVSGLNL